MMIIIKLDIQLTYPALNFSTIYASCLRRCVWVVGGFCDAVVNFGETGIYATNITNLVMVLVLTGSSPLARRRRCVLRQKIIDKTEPKIMCAVYHLTAGIQTCLCVVKCIFD